jgi:hypothetical protein
MRGPIRFEVRHLRGAPVAWDADALRAMPLRPEFVLGQQGFRCIHTERNVLVFVRGQRERLIVRYAQGTAGPSACLVESEGPR